MRRIGDYERNYFHKMAMKKATIVLRMTEPPKIRHYKMPDELIFWWGGQDFYQKEKLFLYPEDFNEWENWEMSY